LKVKDVMNESGTVKTEVKVKQKKTGNSTLSIPLSKNSLDAIKKHLVDRELESVEICNRIDGCPVVEGVCESC